MRLRFFNTYEPVSPFYRDLIPKLLDEGHEIEILISSAEYRQGRTPLRQVLDDDRVRIRQMPCGVKTADARWKKLWASFTYVVGTMLVTLLGRGSDLNFFLTQPPLFQIWGRVLKLIRRQPYSCLLMDIYPDVAVSNGLMREGAVSTRIMKWLKRSALQHAQNVVVIGRCMQSLLENDGVDPKRIMLIPNWANENEIRRLDKDQNPFRSELGLQDHLVCLYSGNIGVSHRFDEWLEVILQLSKHEEIKFVFIGSGSRKAEIESFCETHRLNNVLLLPYLPTEKLSEGLGLGDLHFVSLRDEFVGKVVPSKAYGALVAGKPIIYQGRPEGEIARIILEHELGFVVDEGDVESLKLAVLNCFEDRNRLQELSENAHRVSQELYSREAAVEKYLQLFAEP